MLPHAELEDIDGTFIRGPDVPENTRLGGQPYFSAYTVPLIGPSGDTDIQMVKDGLIRIRLFVSKDVTSVPQQAITVPSPMAFVYLSEQGLEPDWITSAIPNGVDDATTKLDRCRDISGANVTAIDTSGAFLLRYEKVRCLEGLMSRRLGADRRPAT